jgi:nicotinate-nucleotide pyrophosphorylase (carboxylating)
MKVLSADIHKIILLALKEDIGTGDITTNSIVAKSTKAKATILAKQSGVISGLHVAELICKKIDKNISFKQKVKEGMHVSSSTIIAEADGNFRSLLTAERTVLNFLQRMSGIATETSKYVQAVSGLNTKILDTRKTCPGLRSLDKYSVKLGGGVNHRIGLYDMVLIKENHISAAGSITKAVELCRKNITKKTKIEVEVSTIDDTAEALRTVVDIIMLDNMPLKLMHEAVKLINGRCKTEASGGINMNTIRNVAETGVNYISVGSLTHSVTALDIAMYIKEL